MAYPTSPISFVAKSDGPGNTIAAAHMNLVQTEVQAIETQLLDGWTAYTPTWTAASVNPAIGDGTITGRYHLSGTLVTFEIVVSMGSTTTFGTGAWSFTLPVTAASGTFACIGTTLLLDASVAYFVAATAIGSTTTAKVYPNNAAGDGIASTNPFTWVSGDSLRLQGTYVKA